MFWYFQISTPTTAQPPIPCRSTKYFCPVDPEVKLRSPVANSEANSNRRTRFAHLNLIGRY